MNINRNEARFASDYLNSHFCTSTLLLADSKDPLIDDPVSALTALTHAPHLATAMTIKGCTLTAHNLEEIATNYPNLESLTFEGCHILDLISLILLTRLTKMSALAFVGMHFLSDPFEHIATLKQVTSLDLSGGIYNRQFWKNLPKLHRLPRLCSVDFSRSNIEAYPEEKRAFVDAMPFGRMLSLTLPEHSYALTQTPFLTEPGDATAKEHELSERVYESYLAYKRATTYIKRCKALPALLEAVQQFHHHFSFLPLTKGPVSFSGTYEQAMCVLREYQKLKNGLQKAYREHIQEPVFAINAVVAAYEFGCNQALIEQEFPNHAHTLTENFTKAFQKYMQGSLLQNKSLLQRALVGANQAKEVELHLVTRELLQVAKERFQKTNDPLLCELALMGGASLSELISHTTKPSALQRAVEKASRIVPLHTGMSTLETFQVCYYIENELMPTLSKTESLYRKRSLPHLPRSVEYAAAEGEIYIHLKSRNINKLGLGASKRITRSILYSENPPFFIVQAAPRLTGETVDLEPFIYKNEMHYLTKFKNLNGIVKTYSVFAFVRRDAVTPHCSIVQKHYNQGSLHQVKPHLLTFKQKCDLFLSLVEGLANMHERDCLHGDLHSQQCFVELVHEGGEERCRGVLGDFGLTWEPALEPAKVKWHSLFWVTRSCRNLEDPTHRRLEKEFAEDSTQKYSPGHFYFRYEVAKLASIMWKFFSEKSCNMHNEQSQALRHHFENRLNDPEEEDFLPVESLQYILLRMMAWPEKKAFNALEAFHAVQAAL